MNAVMKSVFALVALLAIAPQSQAYICRTENGVMALGSLWPSEVVTGEVKVTGIPVGDEAAVFNGEWVGCTIMPRYDENLVNVAVINCRSLGSTPGTVDMTYYPDSSRVVLTHFTPEGKYQTKVITGECKGRGLDRLY